ncbi:CKMT2 [Symbiodinium sp. CCMP2592]|nr:CKMT2 [Symbiodinium sp. CCMP2592]
MQAGFPADGSIELPDLSQHSNLVAEVFRKDPGLYDRLKERRTKLGTRLARCIKSAVDVPHSGDACLFAGDEDCFDTFSEIFDVVISRLHGLLPAGDVVCPSPPRRTSKSASRADAERVDPKRLDPTGHTIHSVEVSAVRNLRGFRFPAAMDAAERAEVEMLVAKAIRGLAPAVTGVYFPLRQSTSYMPRLGGMDEFEEARLQAAGLHFGLPEDAAALASGSYDNWPHGRGVFASADRDLAVWTNRQEHLTIVSVAMGDGLGKVYRKLVRALDGLGQIIQRGKPGAEEAFATSERLGFLTSDLHRLGAALQASVLLKLPRLAAMEASHPSSAAGSWRSWAGLRRVKVEAVSTLASGKEVEGYFRISNMDVFNATDEEILSSLEEVAFRLVVAEQQITTLTADSDQLFPILTSVLSAAEARGESRTSLLSVFSGVMTASGTDGEELTQEMLAAMMREATPQDASRPGHAEEEELGSLKDRVRLAMYSKLEDGSLDQALQDAADTSGAQHFSDLPPPPPPLDACDDGDIEADAVSQRPAHAAAPRKELQSLEKEPETEPMPAAEEAARQAAQVQRQPTPQELAALRRRTAELLAQAADSGGLEQILTEVKKEMFDEVRNKVAGLLTEAADNGALEKILQDVKTNDVQDPKWELRQKAAKLLSEAADTGLLEKILNDKERPNKAALPDELRQKAAKLLSEAADTGLLEKILNDKERPNKAALPDELRQKAAKLLSEAADSGLLEKVLGDQERSKKASQESIRQKAAKLLSEAADTGLLEKVLGDQERSKKAASQEAVRQKAAKLLTEAADTGRLEKVLEDQERSKKAASQEAVRQKAAKLLTEAADTGRLERVLGEQASKVNKEKGDDSPKKAGGASVRERAAQLLSEAAENGELEKALAKLGPNPTSSPEDELSEIRAAAKASLLEAAENGALERIVSDLQMEKAGHLANVRAAAAELLAEAAETGRLQQVLGEVQQRRAKADEASLLEVRQRAAMLLSEAAADGKLEKVLKDIHAKDGQPELPTAEDRLAATRAKVRSQLQEAAADGRLEKALGAVGKEAGKTAAAAEAYNYDSDFEEFLSKPKAEEAAYSYDSDFEEFLSKPKASWIRSQILAALNDGSLEEAGSKDGESANSGIMNLSSLFCDDVGGGAGAGDDAERVALVVCLAVGSYQAMATEGTVATVIFVARSDEDIGDVADGGETDAGGDDAMIPIFPICIMVMMKLYSSSVHDIEDGCGWDLSSSAGEAADDVRQRIEKQLIAALEDGSLEEAPIARARKPKALRMVVTATLAAMVASDHVDLYAYACEEEAPW